MICMNWTGKDWDAGAHPVDAMAIFYENSSKEKCLNRVVDTLDAKSLSSRCRVSAMLEKDIFYGERDYGKGFIDRADWTTQH